MPTYTYRSSSTMSCSYCRDGFELVRKMTDPELILCPECGAEITQVISAPNLTLSSPSLDTKNIEKHGFTQYKKSSKGVYEKTAGKGPNVISADSD